MARQLYQDYILNIFSKFQNYVFTFGWTYTKIGTIQRRLAWPLRKDDTCKIVKRHISATSLSNERACCHSIQQFLISWSSYSPFYAHTVGYVTRSRGVVSSNPVANKVKTAFNFLEHYIILENIYFTTKTSCNRIQFKNMV